MRTLEAIKKLGKKITGKEIAGNTVDEAINNIADNHGIVLVSPDKSVWDISIDNDGEISGTKRT